MTFFLLQLVSLQLVFQKSSYLGLSSIPQAKYRFHLDYNDRLLYVNRSGTYKNVANSFTAS